MEFPGVAITVLTVGLAWIVFQWITGLIAMRYRGTAAADAWLDMAGHGAVQP